MKKLLAIFLIPVFLLMTAGVAITSLYCKGKISEVGINVKPCCKDVNKGGCCNTKTKIIQVDDAFASIFSTFEINKHVNFYIPNIQSYLMPVSLNITYTKSYWDKAPPFAKSEFYILFHSLII